MSIRSLFCALSVALLCGCSSHYTWKASIPLTQTATEACLEQALEQEPGVIVAIYDPVSGLWRVNYSPTHVEAKAIGDKAKEIAKRELLEDTTIRYVAP